MIKFFRHLRQTLIMENKTSKYLKYAIGEIVLVVIGILIALQINNWNEDRKDSIQEKKYLLRLVEELDIDLDNISSAINALKNRKQRAKFLMKTIENPQLVEDSANYFVKSIEYAGYTSFPVISDNTFEEVKSSGKLSLITNESIRGALQQYYSWTSKRNQYNFIREDIQLNYLNKQKGILNAEQQISMGSFANTYHFNKTEAKLTFERMVQKPDFLELLPIIIKSQIRTGETFEDIKQQSLDLKMMIQDELNNR